MLDRKNKEDQKLEVSLGIVTGFILMAFANVLFRRNSWREAFGDPRIVTGIAGVLLGFYFLYRRRKKEGKDIFKK